MGQCWTKDMVIAGECINTRSHEFETISTKITRYPKQCWPQSCKQSSSNKDDATTELAGGNVQLITTMEKWEKETSEANKDGKTIVVNFSASWCIPCRQIAAAYRELAEKYSSSILFLTVDVDALAVFISTLQFLTADVDALAEFSTTWDIKATPTFFVLRDGRQLDKLVGANKAELQRKITGIAESNMRTTSLN
ncbi:UNVERIFIED_CONTAM: Thioredoxin H-type [Sesamum radiatum]|uniref:Thioredoxin H-type n=1 Tax=Sesamum radiatum TaxID=300843 RepID=A0AAW2KAW1_SESRA